MGLGLQQGTVPTYLMSVVKKQYVFQVYITSVRTYFVIL